MIAGSSSNAGAAVTGAMSIFTALTEIGRIAVTFTI
jgi:hypothetical protein